MVKTTFKRKTVTKGGVRTTTTTAFVGGKAVGTVTKTATAKRGRGGKTTFVSDVVEKKPSIKKETKITSVEAGKRLQALTGNGKRGSDRLTKVSPIPTIRETPQGTRRDLTPQVDVEVQPPRTIYQVQTGTTEFEGRQVPTVETFATDDSFTSRPATPSEKENLNEYIQTERTKELSLQPPRSKTSQIIGEIKGRLRKFGAEPFGVSGGKERIIKGYSNIDKRLGGSGKVGALIGGTVASVFPERKKEIVTKSFLFLVGGAVGSGVKGTGIFLSKIPKAGGTLSKGFKLGTYATGVGLTGAYGVTTGVRISTEEDYGEKGLILGSSATELALFGGGYKAGAKGVSKGLGLIRTKGREFIPLERLTQKEVISGKRIFPEAPSKTHLKLFKETPKKIPELTEGTPGGFHTTPEKFWKGEIKPAPGTSELPGLYTSPELSPHFLKLGGKGYSLKPTIQSITAGDEPAIAFLKPSGFRGVGFRRTKPYDIEGQTFRYSFKRKPREGYIDVPKMKTEIEGVARPEAGAYKFESGKYYTEVEGVRVPIDVFRSDVITSKTKIKGGGKTSLSKQFKTGEYYLPSRKPTQRLGKFDSRSSKSMSSVLSSLVSRTSRVSKPSSRASRTSYRSSIISRTSKRYSPTSLRSSLSSYVSRTSGRSSRTSRTSRRITPPTLIPKLKFDINLKPSKTKTKKDTIGLKFKGLYSPSVEARVFKIKGVKPTKRSIETGVGIRPLLK